MVGDGGGVPDVIVIAFGDPTPLAATLGALMEPHKIVIVDNDPRGAAEPLARRHGAIYLPQPNNPGFAAGVNAGMAMLAGSSADVLLLNPDARIEESDLRALHERLLVDARLACVAPAQHGTSGEHRVLWPLPTPGRLWREAIGVPVAPREGRQFVVGSVLLIRRAAWEDVGPFDERYFLYAEETDWQRRAQARGWRVALCPEIHAEHDGGGTSSDPARRERLAHAGTETYIRKWYGARGWASYRAAALTAAALRSMLPGERGRAARRRWHVYREGPIAAVRRLDIP